MHRARQVGARRHHGGHRRHRQEEAAARHAQPGHPRDLAHLPLQQHHRAGPGVLPADYREHHLPDLLDGPEAAVLRAAIRRRRVLHAGVPRAELVPGSAAGADWAVGADGYDGVYYVSGVKGREDSVCGDVFDCQVSFHPRI